MVQPEQPWLRVDELAAKEGVSKRTVYRWLKQGKVESRESGEIMLYRRRVDGHVALEEPSQKQARDELVHHLLALLEESQERERELQAQAGALREQLGALRAENQHLHARLVQEECHEERHSRSVHPFIVVWGRFKNWLDQLKF